MPKQLSFAELKKPNPSFGGSLIKGHPKGKRPLASKLPIHLTLRATASTLRLPANFGVVNEILHGTAEKYGVRIYRYANVGNHLHVLIKLPRVGRWHAFIREVTGRIALAVGRRARRFWMHRPHTRVVQGWKKAFRWVQEYIYLNRVEAEGFISLQQIRTVRELRALLEIDE